ncbi:YafY family protein [Nonomuraea africana]|uniref:DNA-binding transcriptional regulator YafY n=1 Tax=Nonomuraea africana TaxID=46171 RepID=A0ABR9KHT4_9ACTN|nr:YafY family protein [Nonomuraea africana]MBE1561574.1 putative DNA-binding transcriptional regulator YafY [Nonomuraea africana]
MANTSARMLRLLSLLQTHRHWPGGALAARLEVSERTLRRDIDRLRELGYPVDAARGVSGGYQLRSGTAMPPLLLDDEEAVAIAVGLGTAAGIDGIEETSVHALAKVVQVMPPRLRRRVEALRSYTLRPAVEGPTVDAAVLTTLAQACRDDERLAFTYTSASGEASERLAEPYRLVALRRRWYLVAWDVGRADWRTFRVDRLTAPAATGVRFRPRDLPGGDAAAFVVSRLGSPPVRHAVVVHVHAPLGQVEQVVAQMGGLVEALDEGTCRLVMHVDDFDWPILILAALGAPFDVIEPEAFRDRLRTTATLFRNATT